jgi:glycosyltransferase involved in cell wall biosynthesis
VDTFVEAFGRLPDTTRAVMIGDFTEAARRAVAARAARLACRPRLELREWVERAQIRQAFAQATVLVFPSLWPETLGIVGIEALACGVPAVASDIGGVREWLIPGKTGYLAEPGNVADFAEKIEKLLFDPAMNREFGAHGQRLVRDRFAPAEHVRRLLDIYRSSSETHPVNRAGAAH